MTGFFGRQTDRLIVPFRIGCGLDTDRRSQSYSSPMKDLIQLILQYLPQYFKDVGSLLAGPKRFIAQADPENSQTFVTLFCLLEFH
jgi:hypothetical protein